MRDNRIEPKNISSQAPQRKEVFIKKTKESINRKNAREHLGQFHLGCELVKVIRHFFPNLLPMLRQVHDPRHPSYITYDSSVLLMTRILSSIFYISSMRKTSIEFNSETVIENIGMLCEIEELSELPYWETINKYLKKIDPNELQHIVCELVRRLLRSRAFEESRMRGKYWQILVDGTSLGSSRTEWDKRSLYKVHNKGTTEEYKEYYYYVVEAKLVLQDNIIVSIMTEFVENEGEEVEKQDCERNACYRLMERLKKAFPMLPICLCGDSLYACERFFEECKAKHWHFLLRFKEGSIPSIDKEYQSLKQLQNHGYEKEKGSQTGWYDYVTKIEYRNTTLQMAEYKETGKEQSFYFITDFSIQHKNIEALIESGRKRWKIENEGFNTQKKQGYYLEHRYSKDYQGTKNHYYLIQIGHMISQIIEVWEKLWKKAKQSREQKHRRLLEAWKTEKIKDYEEELDKRIQIRWS